MAEWKTQPYNPMERQAHETIELDPARSSANIEEPIIAADAADTLRAGSRGKTKSIRP